MIKKDDIIKELKTVYDPEISVNIYDLGLIYDISIDEEEGWVKIIHTLTSAFCPEADLIVSDIRVATSQVEGVTDVDVITTFEPPFGPEMMSEKAKLELGI